MPSTNSFLNPIFPKRTRPCNSVAAGPSQRTVKEAFITLEDFAIGEISYLIRPIPKYTVTSKALS